MPAPSQLAIQTSALQRRVKEETSYYKELEQQKARIDKLQQDLSDENAEYTLRQEVSCFVPVIIHRNSMVVGQRR